MSSGSETDISCPAPDCSFEGTLSRVIHHVTDRDDADHTWNALGFDHSWEFRERHQTGTESGSETGDGSDTGDGNDPAANEGARDGAASGADDGPTRSERPLEAVPGIGAKRAAALREAGYERAADVARASEAELSGVSSVSDASARCIRATAREVCGHADTRIARLADSLDADREAVADAYGSLARAVVAPEDARETLAALFDPDTDGSVVDLTEYSLEYRHFLYEAGFERLDDVARASVDELADARYVGETLAENLRERARERVGERTGAPERGDSISPADPDGGSESGDDRGGEPATGAGTEVESGVDPEGVAAEGEYPGALVDRDQWLLWKETEDGRKVPRAPWETGDPLQYVSAMEPANWVSFAEARRWQSKLPHDLELAYVLTRDDGVVFLDLDDVVADGEPSPEAEALIDRAESYATVSTSGTGVHVFVRGSLSDDVKSLTGPVGDGDEGTLEVYDRNRFVAVTGDRVDGTPTEVTDGESLLAALEEEFASVSSETPDRATAEPRRDREELRELETTDDIQDVFDAIQQTRPSDITMRSTETREHGDGTYSYDPSWVHSESGTRLGVLDDVWIYRKGMIALNALQLVALEEGIIADERDYPEGEAFWEAVEALRDRGAHVPRFEPEDEPVDEASSTADEEIDEWEVAKRINYGEPVRAYVHPYDRDYQESLALELAPRLVEAAESLRLTAAVAYRAAGLYARGHAAGTVPGAAHESSLGAALRIASIEAGTPRPLADVADALDETPKSVRKKFHRLMQDTDLSETVAASDLIVDPVDYAPYMARKLRVSDDRRLRDSVRELLGEAELDGASNPMSEVAAAFYVAMDRSADHSVTQCEVADAAGLSEVTIRNNYRKYADAA